LWPEKLRAVGAELGVEERILVAFDLHDRASVCRLADRGNAVERRDARGGDEARAVARVRDAVHLAGQILGRGDDFLRGRIDQFDAPISAKGDALAIGREGKCGDIRLNARGRLNFWRRWFWKRRLGAVRSLRAGIDPGADDVDLGFRGLGVIRRRHCGFNFAREHADHETRVGAVRHEHRALLAALLQLGERRKREAAFQIGVVVAAGAVLGKDRRDVFRKIRRSSCRCYRNNCRD
jgi:hypothetical protein